MLTRLIQFAVVFVAICLVICTSLVAKLMADFNIALMSIPGFLLCIPSVLLVWAIVLLIKQYDSAIDIERRGEELQWFNTGSSKK